MNTPFDTLNAPLPKTPETLSFEVIDLGRRLRGLIKYEVRKPLRQETLACKARVQKLDDAILDMAKNGRDRLRAAQQEQVASAFEAGGLPAGHRVLSERELLTQVEAQMEGLKREKAGEMRRYVPTAIQILESFKAAVSGYADQLADAERELRSRLGFPLDDGTVARTLRKYVDVLNKRLENLKNGPNPQADPRGDSILIVE